jgi:hypothetical protein
VLFLVYLKSSSPGAQYDFGDEAGYRSVSSAFRAPLTAEPAYGNGRCDSDSLGLYCNFQLGAVLFRPLPVLVPMAAAAMCATWRVAAFVAVNSLTAPAARAESRMSAEGAAQSRTIARIGMSLTGLFMLLHQLLDERALRIWGSALVQHPWDFSPHRIPDGFVFFSVQLLVSEIFGLFG